jgi:cyclophilin family peptidyl-prolyl cis-trans isomerase
MMAGGIRVLVACLVMAGSVSVAGAQEAENPVVVIETSMGEIAVELFRERAPRTVENFLTYARDGYYSGTVFHRVIPGFMIQGGGLTADLERKPTRPPIANEATNGLRNERGTVAMARTSEVRSATSQFFINTSDNVALDHKGMAPAEYGYAVFGRVIEGMDVVDQIEKVRTGSRGGHQNVPVDPVTITAIRIKS